MLANGRGKMRSNSNGKPQRTLRWMVPVLRSCGVWLGSVMPVELMDLGRQRALDIRTLTYLEQARD